MQENKHLPELPEVETTRRGIEPHLRNQVVERVIVRQRSLRWPVPRTLNHLLSGQTLLSVNRRGKYLLLQATRGTLLLHLGMSGCLRIVPTGTPAEKHDHVDMVLSTGQTLRLTDPRRFGAVLWIDGEPTSHPLLNHLGPEPLGSEFDGEYLFTLSRGRKQAIKPFLMDSRMVVGIGNIYANEALFRAGISPMRAAGSLQKIQCADLVQAVRDVLLQAIEAGGTSLQDFLDPQGKPGYFAQALQVYGRGGEPCMTCGIPLKELRLGQRSTVFCRRCQV
jgi:formamidopyrimidine-DNA glycosylase